MCYKDKLLNSYNCNTCNGKMYAFLFFSPVDVVKITDILYNIR